MNGDGSGRVRRGLLFSVAPVVMALLAVLGLASVIRADEHHHAATPVADPVSSLTTAPATTSPPAATSTASPSPTADPVLLQKAVAAVGGSGAAGTQFGVAVLDRGTGQEVLGAEGTAQFYSASVLKLFVITALLHDQETGQVSLSGTDDDEITRALELSDDDAMDELWEDYDGPDLVQQMVQLAGLKDTQLPDDTTQWGETLISARDVLSVYQYVFTGLSAADSKLVLTDLNNAGDSGADGFDQSFGLLAPGLRTADTKAKQGWMMYGDQMMLHTTGVIGADDRYVVAVLSMQPTDRGWTAGSALVTAATAQLVKVLGPAATQ